MESPIFSRPEFYLQKISGNKSWQIGPIIEDYDSNNSLQKGPVITSSSAHSAEIIHQFSHFSKIPLLDNIPDAGLLQINDPNKLTGFWLHLLEMQKTFVSFNAELNWLPELLYAFDIQGRPFNCSILSEKSLPVVKEVWPKNLLHVNYVGIQGHLLNPSEMLYTHGQSIEAIRLGQLQKNIEQAEPLLRNADIAIIDLSILKSSEIPDIKGVGASGISSEALCQLSRYLGFSEKLKCIAITGLPEAEGLSEQTANICAQVLWYFLQGTTSRRLDYPLRKEHLVEFLVESTNNNPIVKFFKSDISDRWWFKIPGQLPTEYATHGLFPCSFEEYEQTCFGEIPDRLINAMHRFDHLKRE